MRNEDDCLDIQIKGEKNPAGHDAERKIDAKYFNDTV